MDDAGRRQALARALAGIEDYLYEGAAALGRIPRDLRRYADDLPVIGSAEAPSLPWRAVEGTNFAIDRGVRGVTGGRVGLADALSSAGLPTGMLERGIEDFGARNAAELKVLADVGNAAAGAQPASGGRMEPPIVWQKADDFLASKGLPGHNPPGKPQRPFEADYPRGVEVDADGKLARDIEGRRLGGGTGAPGGREDTPPHGTLPRLFGRRVPGGPDETLPPTQSAYDALAEALVGAVPQRVAPREIGGDAGRYRKQIDRVTGDPY